MFIKYLLGLFAIAFIVAGVQVCTAVEEPKVEVDERANPLVKIVTKIIGSVFTGASVSCLSEAANQCKSNWMNPGAAINCAKEFLKVNKGQCAVGK